MISTFSLSYFTELVMKYFLVFKVSSSFLDQFSQTNDVT